MSEMTYEELRQAQAEEYGEYIAAEPITVDGALAFNTGDPVPKGHVANGVVREDQVKRPPSPEETAKAERAAAADAKAKAVAANKEGTV